MKEGSLPLPGGCWKLPSIRLPQAKGGPNGNSVFDGRQVVGMDLHRRRSVLVWMTEDGRRPSAFQDYGSLCQAGSA
jgi:hypothetical protein